MEPQHELAHTGTASIVEAPAKADALVSTLIGTDTRSCRGDYFAESLLDRTDDSSMIRIFAVCQLRPTTSFVYYLVAPREGGEFYLLATTAITKSPTDTTDQSVKDIDEAIRKALHQATSR